MSLLGGAAAVWPLAPRALQPAQMRRIGVLMSTAAVGVGRPATLLTHVAAPAQVSS
jgi:hypothetical protein